MKVIKKNRKFKVGFKENSLIITHIADIKLKDNELVNFKFGKYDYNLVKKNWGFYATPSINSRLKREGFKTALVENSFSDTYIMLVHKLKINKFKKYCKDHKQKIVKWLSV